MLMVAIVFAVAFAVGGQREVRAMDNPSGRTISCVVYNADGTANQDLAREVCERILDATGMNAGSIEDDGGDVRLRVEMTGANAARYRLSADDVRCDLADGIISVADIGIDSALPSHLALIVGRCLRAKSGGG